MPKTTHVRIAIAEWQAIIADGRHSQEVIAEWRGMAETLEQMHKRYPQLFKPQPQKMT